MNPIVFETDMEEFIAQCAIRFCPECGEKIPMDRKHLKVGRPHVFCSAECKKKFWNRYDRKERWNCFEKHTCPVCGKEFYAERETKRVRKYCSHACSNRGRTMERNHA